MSVQVQFLNRGKPVIETLSSLAALAKFKLTWLVAPLALVVGFLLISALMLARGANILLAQEPNIPEMERHLETNDKRIDAHDAKLERIIDLINQKFDKLESGRESLEHDVTYLYGGIAVIGVLLGVGVIKLNAGVSGVSRDDLQQLAALARELRNPRGRR